MASHLGRSNLGARQLALALGHAESFARHDFLSAPSNVAALALVERWPDWPDQAVVLVGPEGAGKSHLAAIWADAAGARFLSARALAGASLPAALATGALVIEDVAPGHFDERAMFHLINLAREEQAFILLTARSLPAGWAIDLRDLASRLRTLPVVTVTAPDDNLLRAVLIKLFADRQLAVDERLVGFVASRIERSIAAARAVVALLDREAMQQQRPLTRALAAEVLRLEEARERASEPVAAQNEGSTTNRSDP
jgi:chromosomal replication initiation ATPase DnaA